VRLDSAVEPTPLTTGYRSAQEREQLELLERDAELASVVDLIGGIGDGGQLLAIEGPPGIGKTALLAEAKGLGEEAGLQVLSARGSELERSFSYGVVRQLFEPLLVSVPAEERAELLAGAAELAAPLFQPAAVAGEPAPDSALATLHGLYWLTANLAARRPLLLLVDDLHWSDLPSLRWLAYLLPRMEGVSVLVVGGLRPGEPRQDETLLDQIVSDPMAIVIRPAPLSVEAATVVLRENLSASADETFCAACHSETAGNPLLLRELVRAIADEGLIPIEANVPRLHELAARAGSRAVSLRLSRLPPEATALAQAVAILGDGADPRQAAALVDLDDQAAFEAADALARLDVLRPQPSLSFVHPLIRGAVYEALTPLERERGHARAARLLATEGEETERVAAHLLRTPPAGDSWVVASLRQAARRAASRGASENAVAYLRRALAEPPAVTEQAELALELGSAESHVDGGAAIEHLQQAHRLTDDPIPRARIALLLGRQLFLLRDEKAVTFYRDAIQELGGADSELERLLEAGALNIELFAPSLHAAALKRLERVRSRPADETVGEKLLLSLLAYHDARAGAPASEVIPRVRRALGGGTLIRSDVFGAVVPSATVLAMADLDEVLAIYEDALAEAHKRGSTLAFAAVKVFRAQTLLWRGDLAGAEADARDALAAAREWGASARFSGHAAAFLADALIEKGRLDEAAAALARAGMDETPPSSTRLLYFRDTAARLRVLRGDLTGGVAELLDEGRYHESVGHRNPAFMAWRSPAALALLQLGEPHEARRLAREELELARAWGAPRALGAALRAAGLIEGGEQGLALLEEAVQAVADSPAKLEHAKARTELGSALRRANRRSQAREHLRQAVELATICGATHLAARAEHELLATGARPRRIALSGVESLTPSERRVAELAAAGPTNREIAQTLFVTQRTIEVHLTSIYRKLGISSRSQLAAALADAPRN
jgi:DNA-binding CsgD family transcriptional regulator/tetratricopeptide (TPR) repeat protein